MAFATITPTPFFKESRLLVLFNPKCLPVRYGKSEANTTTQGPQTDLERDGPRQLIDRLPLAQRVHHDRCAVSVRVRPQGIDPRDGIEICQALPRCAVLGALLKRACIALRAFDQVGHLLKTPRRAANKRASRKYRKSQDKQNAEDSSRDPRGTTVWPSIHKAPS